MAGFATLAERTKVKACYHTHSAATGQQRRRPAALLTDLDPHHVGAFFDTGHTAVNGGPPRMETGHGAPVAVAGGDQGHGLAEDGHAWAIHVVPVGRGIVRFGEIGKALADVQFTGTVSLHGEYDTNDLAERKRLAKEELMALRKVLGA